MVQQLASFDQHHARCRCAIDRDPKTLDERCFISFSQTPELVDERRRYRTPFVLEGICHLHAALLTDDQQSGEYGLNVKYGLTVHDNNLLHLLIMCNTTINNLLYSLYSLLAVVIAKYCLLQSQIIQCLVTTEVMQIRVSRHPMSTIETKSRLVAPPHELLNTNYRLLLTPEIVAE